MSNLNNRLKKLEGKQPKEPDEDMEVIIHGNGLPEDQQTGVIRIIEHIADEPAKEPNTNLKQEN